ncbi:MAG: hypothetical protein Q8927_20945, partial [Bacteroidota bacterium]|nr:hypothetical protein [Bacteroidota bacterium]
MTKKSKGPAGTSSSGKFKPDFRVAGLSLAGFAGLLIGLIAMSYGGLRFPLRSSVSAFHEVDYSGKNVAAEAVGFLDDSMHHVLANLKARLENKAAADSLTILNSSIEDAKKTIVLLDGYLAEIADAGLADTVVNKKLNGWLHFAIGPDDPRRWEDEFSTAKTGWLTKVNGWIRVPGSGSTLLTHPLSENINISSFQTNAQLMAKYPQLVA